MKNNATAAAPPNSHYKQLQPPSTLPLGGRPVWYDRQISYPGTNTPPQPFANSSADAGPQDNYLRARALLDYLSTGQPNAAHQMAGLLTRPPPIMHQQSITDSQQAQPRPSPTGVLTFMLSRADAPDTNRNDTRIDLHPVMRVASVPNAIPMESEPIWTGGRTRPQSPDNLSSVLRSNTIFQTQTLPAASSPSMADRVCHEHPPPAVHSDNHNAMIDQLLAIIQHGDYS